MAEGRASRDEPGWFPQQDSESSRHALVQWEHASIQACTVMNLLGYGPEVRQVRGKAYREIDSLGTAQFRGLAMVISTGSKAEGLSSFLESDWDKMFVLNRLICLEESVNTTSFPGEITVLRSYSRLSHPGHCRLLLESRGTMIHSNVNDALCDDGYGRALLSSDLYVNNWAKSDHISGLLHRDRAGPSLPVSICGLNTDTIHALHYYCPSVLSKWAARPRHWPPPEAVQKVVSLGAFLTPVGFKGSEYQHVEWRVCFNAGEIELVNYLNDTQIKLYVLLKMVKNDILNPPKKEVSSYTLKNIVFWIAENNCQSLFHEKSLFHWLHAGLDALRVALITRELPYYMITDRNLMATSGFDGEQQRIWISTITEMLSEGPKMILRLPKIRQTLIGHPEPFRWYNRRKREQELLMLMYYNRYYRCWFENRMVATDGIIQAASSRMNEILIKVCLRMLMEGSRFDSLGHVFIKMLM